MPRPGDILLVHSNEIQARLIQISTRSWWNHVAIAVSAVSLVEAVGSGVTQRPITRYDALPADCTRWIDTGLSDAGRTAAATYALSRVGERYDRIEIVSLALGILTGWRFYFGVSGEQICSGLAGEAVVRGGLAFGGDAARMKPVDFSVLFDVTPRLEKPSDDVEGRTFG